MPTRVMTFTETATGVTYTAECSLPRGARLLDVLLETTVSWTAATAPVTIGDQDAPDAIIKALDLAPQQGVGAATVPGAGQGTDWGNGLTGADGPYALTGPGKLYPSGATITAVVSPTVPGGPTGVSRVTLWFEQAQNTYRAAVV